MLDGLGAEGGEEGLVDGARAPGPERDRHEIGNARQHAGHDVAWAHALRF